MKRATPSTTESTMVTGLFRDRESAERAYQSLSDRGYSSDEINLIMADETRDKYFSDNSGSQTELGTKAAEGAGVGGAIGGTIGAIAAAIAAVGTSIAIPGLGLVVAGPIAAALAGAGAGGAAGTLSGGGARTACAADGKRRAAALRASGLLVGPFQRAIVSRQTRRTASSTRRSWAKPS